MLVTGQLKRHAHVTERFALPAHCYTDFWVQFLVVKSQLLCFHLRKYLTDEYFASRISS